MSEQPSDNDENTHTGVKEPRSHSLLRSSLVVGVMTMMSRVLGLFRDVVVAGYFGSSMAADAFFVAFKIPNFLRRLFAEGAFSQAFVPVLSEYRTTRPFDEVRILVSRVSGTLAGTLLMVTILCMLGAPVLIRLFAPGFMDEPEKLALAGSMLRITFPYLLLISLTALAGGILNSFNRFAVPAFTPVLLNLSLIGSTLLLTPYFAEPVMALAWGVVIAGVSQLLLQLPFLMQIRLLPLPRWDRQHEGVRRIMKLMIPALFGVSVSQINLLLDTVLASFLQTGSVSWLYYSDRLSELPLGVFGIAIATVILPSLSRKHADDSKGQFSKTLDWAIRLVLLIGIPAGVALFILAEPLIATLFHYGEMQDRDVLMAGMSLQAYSLGLVAFMLIKVLAPGYFARQDTKTPVQIAVKAMVANMVFNLMLVFWLQHVGLALATTISAFMNAGLLFLGLKKAGVFKPQAGWWLYAGRLLFANAVMAAVLLMMDGEVQQWLDWSMWQRVGQMSFTVAAGLAAYGFSLLLSGIRPSQFRH
ncbi:murein biosynthesis integral membrane protein MurJ [Endozoicomonas euniceicola]|uniref:Probable lipid II flippase MurJ n=1 Tax=Endozoicomonas euniceicola TaxID=1234143 RepID=A0ABY6GR95_9GAMM|nr:murein biosynthesis integral membrane protein MurJ [Endozoicomonas euniceicola]UYM15275.1 murein biosynthesis integral membrane protein MurJ [Endozoicomonas euniceicola]